MSPEIVECHSGYTYGERPIALHWQEERLIIQDVEARWRTPGGPCFRVRTDDGRTFELSYLERDGEWQTQQA